jgi:hypothetical protein
VDLKVGNPPIESASSERKSSLAVVSTMPLQPVLLDLTFSPILTMSSVKATKKKDTASAASGDCTNPSSVLSMCLASELRSCSPNLHRPTPLSAVLPSDSSLALFTVPDKRSTIVISLAAIGLLVALMHGAGEQIRSSPPLIIGAGFLSSIVFFFLVVVRVQIAFYLYPSFYWLLLLTVSRNRMLTVSKASWRLDGLHPRMDEWYVYSMHCSHSGAYRVLTDLRLACS